MEQKSCLEEMARPSLRGEQKRVTRSLHPQPWNSKGCLEQYSPMLK